jgi:hypothetical protein
VGWLPASDYWVARLVFQRTLAGVYLLAFVVAINQFRPLLGERGLLPVPRFVESAPFRRTPSIFHLHYSDRLLAVVAWAGAALASACALGLPERGPIWLSMLAWAGLWALYLSIVNVGQVFYGFGWEMLLLETGFLAVFLGPASVAPPIVVVIALRWLLFRLEFGAGLIKLRGDPCWRDLTCLFYHHETQPMPNPLSWFFHHLPRPVHRVEVAANHFAQLVAPVFLFAPQPLARVAGAVILASQAWLVASGNFSWLNLLTMALAVMTLDGSAFGGVISPAHHLAAYPGWFQGATVVLALLIAGLSIRPIRNLASPGQLMNSSFDPLHLVNTYGAFGRVTKERFEIVIEGTDATVPDASATWREYGFRAKPGDPCRRPPQVAPYHLRLDWLMWFVAIPGWFRHRWLFALLQKLLENDRPTLKLLATNPFPDAPPNFVRASRFRYRFSSRLERRHTRVWWIRSRAGELVPPISLQPDSGHRGPGTGS